MASATGMPWETGLISIKDSVKGPIAVTAGVIAIAVLGIMAAYGGELNDFMKKTLIAVLAIGVAVSAGTFMTILFPTAVGTATII